MRSERTIKDHIRKLELQARRNPPPELMMRILEAENALRWVLGMKWSPARSIEAEIDELIEEPRR